MAHDPKAIRVTRGSSGLEAPPLTIIVHSTSNHLLHRQLLPILYVSVGEIRLIAIKKYIYIYLFVSINTRATSLIYNIILIILYSL